MAFVATKGIVPVCGCRKPEQVQQLHDAAATRLEPEEVAALEELSDSLSAKVFGKDIFRFAVKS